MVSGDSMTTKRDELAKYLIVGCTDGAFNSYVVSGLEEARRKVAEEYYSGTYEEAQKDDVVSFILKEFDDQKNCWHWDQSVATRWESKGEQSYLEVILIRTSTVDARDEEVERLELLVDEYQDAICGFFGYFQNNTKKISPNDARILLQRYKSLSKGGGVSK